MSRRIILLEGGEGTGKTSIAKWLLEKHGFHIVKLPTPGSDFEKVIFNKDKLAYGIKLKAMAAVLDMELAVLRSNPHPRVVYDRGILSTCAYQDAALASEALYACDAMKIVSEITDVVILNVKPEVGLSREAEQNEVSEAGMDFHNQVNSRFKMLGEVMKTVLKYRSAERTLGMALPRASLIQTNGSEADQWLMESLGQRPNMMEWDWAGLESVSVIDTETNGLNCVKNILSTNIGLPA